MSREAQAASPSPSVSRQPTWSFKIQNFVTPQTYAAKSVADSKGHQTTTTTPSQIATASSSVQEVQNDVSTEQPTTKRVRKRRRLNKEEGDMKNEIAASVSANLELDQIMALYPDTESPFENKLDVVQRLLPYHIYQHPARDLDETRGIKGKARATQADLLREEVNEMRFALNCHNRFRSLEQRMKRARIKPGQHTVPLDQAILTERFMLESEQSETSLLEQELSSTRSELDKVLRAQRMAKSTAIRTTLGSSGNASVNGASPTIQSPATSYYGYAASTFNATTTSSYSNYYNSYTYPYAQSFIPGVAYTNSTKSTVPGVSSFQSGAQPQSTLPSSSVSQSSNSPSSGPTITRPPPVSIPLQLPVTSLPALQSLGILPVPKASVPAPPARQPAAVLLGSSNNGNMLSLEINAALLQPPQMSGLAILLSSLVRMSGGPNGGGQTSKQTQGSDAAAVGAGQNTPHSATPAPVVSDSATGVAKNDSN